MRPEPPTLRPELVDGFGFTPLGSLPGAPGRAGMITTPHGKIKTPAFVAVGTKATVKAVLPESMAALGAQALLAALVAS
jgi:queuine tRNA-ribosyltransferase